MNDDNYTLMDTILIERPTIGDNKILQLDVTMQHRGVMASSYCLAHLGKYRGDKAEGDRCARATEMGEGMKECPV